MCWHFEDLKTTNCRTLLPWTNRVHLCWEQEKGTLIMAFARDWTFCSAVDPYFVWNMRIWGLLRWRRGSGLDCWSDDPGSIPGMPSPCVGPLMARMLKTSLDVLMSVSGRLGTLKTLAAHGVRCPAAGLNLETGQLSLYLKYCCMWRYTTANLPRIWVIPTISWKWRILSDISSISSLRC